MTDRVTECKPCGRYWVPKIFGPCAGQPCPVCGAAVTLAPKTEQPPDPRDELVEAVQRHLKVLDTARLPERFRELTDRCKAYEAALEHIANQHRWAQQDYREYARDVLQKAKQDQEHQQ